LKCVFPPSSQCSELISVADHEAHVDLSGHSVQSGDLIKAIMNKFGSELEGVKRKAGVEEVKWQIQAKNLVLVGGKEEVKKVRERGFYLLQL
jgi:hypothetical protein